MSDVETAKYKIVGLVDKYDEQGNITGQYPVGSVQELPVEQGVNEVAEGRAEAVSDDAVDEPAAADETISDDDEDLEEDAGDEDLDDLGALDDEVI